MRSDLATSSPEGSRNLTQLLERHRESQCFALVDAAKSREVYALLKSLPEDACCSLYDGDTDLDVCAPHLVEIDARTRAKVFELWGQDCVVFLWSAEPLARVRRHFRHFLKVRVEGRRVYFRFYDPRVLRLFVPHCTEQERTGFFGALTGFVVEEPGGKVATLFERTSAGALTVSCTAIA